MHRHTRLLSLLMLTSLLVCLPGCSDGELPRLCIQKKSGEEICADVEIAKTPNQQKLGLMYRTSLPAGHGMLFIFSSDNKRRFTMKNTFIPLDMIFIDRDRKIAGWIENTKPLTPGPYSIEKPSRYVLEVNAFFCRQHGLAVGDVIRCEDCGL